MNLGGLIAAERTIAMFHGSPIRCTLATIPPLTSLAHFLPVDMMHLHYLDPSDIKTAKRLQIAVLIIRHVTAVIISEIAWVV